MKGYTGHHTPEGMLQISSKTRAKADGNQLSKCRRKNNHQIFYLANYTKILADDDQAIGSEINMHDLAIKLEEVGQGCKTRPTS